jgi:Carboxypeptidase regulatory-like domain/TonB-dependent Receptor Plug Domain
MRLRPTSALLLVVLLVAVSSANKLNAQTTTSGGLTGVITDQSNAVVPNADVEIKDSAKGTTQSTKTDREGVYRFFFLAPRRYALTVSHVGFREEKRAVNVLLGPPGTVNVTLEIAKASTTLTVTEDAPLIQAENGDVSATMNQEQISEVPNPGNDLTYIVQTAPGVVMNTDGGGWMAKFSILGMPGTSYAFTVDGLSITENTLNLVRGGPLGLTLGTNQIQEATVITSAYSGQFGNAAGGYINYVSKSGSNAFHGNAEYFWNGTVLNANDWFNQASGNPRPFSIANQWAGSVGGPIRKNKLFFFFDTEGLRLTIPQILFTVIPTPEFEAATMSRIRAKFGIGSASDVFYQKIFDLYDSTPRAASAIPFGPADAFGCAGFSGPNGLGTSVACSRHVTNTRSRPSQDTLTSGRVDWNVGQNDRAFFRLQEEGGTYALGDDPINSVFDADYDNSRWQGQVLETHTFKTTAANQFLLGMSAPYWAYKSKHPAQSLAAFPTQLNFYVPGTFATLGGFNGLTLFTFGTHDLQISDDIVWVRGNHKLGFGMGLDREHWKEYSIFDGHGELNPETMQAFYEGGFDAASPNVDFTTLVQGFSSRPTASALFGGIQVYAQNEWRVRKDLVLSFALRAEHRANASCENRCYSRLVAPFEEISHDPAEPYNQALITSQEHAYSLDPVVWSPRFGFAWQPFGVSRTSVLRGGLGILYDAFQEALGEEFYLNPPNYNNFNAYRNNLAPNEISSLFKDTAASNTAFVNGYATGESLSQLQSRIPYFIPPWVESTERKMHRPQYQRWNLEWQQGLGTKTSLSVGYFGHHGIHELVRDPNANAYGFGSLPPAPCTSPPVPPCSDPRFGEVEQWASRAISNYHGMVASFHHQFSGWGSGLVQINYTYGHALDEISNNGVWSFTQGSSLSSQDPSNLRGAYGPAEYDVRHSMNTNYVWELPLKSLLRGHGPGTLFNGWQVSGTIFARTGFPYTVFDAALSGNLRQNNYFGSIYAVPVGALPENSGCGEDSVFSRSTQPCLPPQYQNGVAPNPNALFVQATCETDFNAGHLPIPGNPCGGPIVSFAQGRNRFRGPSYFNSDLAVMKTTKLPGWENATLVLGFQFFNVLNHPNFGIPDNSSSSQTLGQIFYGEQTPTGILGVGNNGSSRMIQLRADLKF